MIHHDPRTYPAHPGSKGGDTSEAAAQAIAAIASPLRYLALRTLSRLGAATALEVVAQSGRERWTIAPRLSELQALGLIDDDMHKSMGPSGFHTASLRRAIQSCGAFAVVSREPIAAVYASVAGVAAVTGASVMLVETRPEHELQWVALIQTLAPGRPLLLTTVNGGHA